ncbi:hypothetical protein JB92DRAFT_2703719 [Gautieria morchelliformis]|nr:hypothetical protein JB92DRAFT_2703719 [Gautieria morchelliformis]
MTTCSSLPLEELLDVSTLQNHDQISRRFLEISKAILFSYCLRVEYEGKSTDFQILEIEFYLCKNGVHEDPFCHAHDGQRGSAKYFHRSSASSCSTATDAGGYRGGTRKGLDLTFGTSVTSPFFPVPQDLSLQPRGGILLRSMRSMDGSGIVTSGPSLLVDKILSITKSRNISGLVNAKLGGFISALSPTKDETALGTHPAKLYLAACSRTDKTHLPTIHRSPRVGLDLAHPSVAPQRNDLRIQYITKLYRHFVHPEWLKANGRCHTLIGILLERYPAEPTTNESFDCPILMARLKKMTTLKHATLQKYIKDYTQGLTKRSLTEYVGSAGKGASSNPQTFMRMMGVLRRMGVLTTSDAAPA